MMEQDGAAAPQPEAAKPKRPSFSRKAVVGQLWRTAKRQLDAHEEHLADLPRGEAAGEAEAKALAILARTVRELAAIGAPQAAKKDKQTDEFSAADGLRHVAQLRQELARRLDALAAEEAGEAAHEADLDGDGG